MNAQPTKFKTWSHHKSSPVRVDIPNILTCCLLLPKTSFQKTNVSKVFSYFFLFLVQFKKTNCCCHLFSQQFFLFTHVLVLMERLVTLSYASLRIMWTDLWIINDWSGPIILPKASYFYPWTPHNLIIIILFMIDGPSVDPSPEMSRFSSSPFKPNSFW